MKLSQRPYVGGILAYRKHLARPCVESSKITKDERELLLESRFRVEVIMRATFGSIDLPSVVRVFETTEHEASRFIAGMRCWNGVIGIWHEVLREGKEYPAYILNTLLHEYCHYVLSLEDDPPPYHGSAWRTTYLRAMKTWMTFRRAGCPV